MIFGHFWSVQPPQLSASHVCPLLYFGRCAISEDGRGEGGGACSQWSG